MSLATRLTTTTLLALGLLAALSAKAPAADSTPAQLIAEGRDALTAGELDLAEGSFLRATEIAPQLPQAWLGLSVVAEYRGDLAGALSLARRAVEVGPEEASAHLAVGKLLSVLGQTESALAALSEARRLAPDEPMAYRLAARLMGSAEAAPLLEEAIAAIEDPPAVLSDELARHYLFLDDPEKARATAERGLADHANSAELHFVLGRALAALANDLGDGQRALLDQAARSIEESLRLGLERPLTAHLELAKILEAQGRPAKAVSHLEEAVRIQPEGSEAHYRLGLARQRAGDADGARLALERSRDLAAARDRADHAEKKRGAGLNEAQELVEAGRLDDALDRLDTLLAEEPEMVRGLNLRAKVLFSLGRKDEALEAASKARSLSPGVVESHMLAGMFFMDLGKPGEAEAAFLDVVNLAPGQADAFALLGSLAAETGRPERAVEYFDRALNLGAESVALRLRYAEVLHALGRIEDSKRQLEAYRTLLEDSAAPRPDTDGEPGRRRR